MKICILLPSLGLGGIEKVSQNLADFLSKKNSVTILTLDNENQKIYFPNNIRVLSCNNKKLFFSLKTMFFILKNEKFDLVISNSNHINIIVYLLSFIISYKNICIEHGSILNSLLNLNFIKKFIYTYLIKFFYVFNKNIIFVSEGVYNDFRKINPKFKKNIIYNSFDINKIRSLSRYEIPNNILSEEDDNIIYVGRLSKEKNLMLLFMAFNKIQIGRNIKLIIIGEGPCKTEIYNFAKENNFLSKVVFLNYQDNPYKFISKSSMLVLSSLTEGLPTVLVESLICGTPVVSTNCPHGPAEILNNGMYGILAENNNLESLIEGINNMLKNYDYWKNLDYGSLLSNFDINNISEQYNSFILKSIEAENI